MELDHTITSNDRFLMFNVWVTLDCNFDCAYCYEQGGKKNIYVSDELTTQIEKFIIKTCIEKDISVIWLNLHGGEPLLNKKCIFNLVNSLRENHQIRKMYTSTTTNGSIFDPQIVDYIDELSISIDGKEKSHDLKRCRRNGGATFHESYENALRYLKLYPKLRVRMVISPQTVDDLSENVLFLIGGGFKTIIPAVDFFDQTWTESQFDVLYEQLKVISEYRKSLGKDDLIIGLLDEPIRRMGHCVVGEDGYQIYADGKVYPCTYSVGREEFVIGTVYDGLYREKIRCMNRQLAGEIDECYDCGFYPYCTTRRCYFLNEAITGNLYKPSEVICATEHIRIRLQEINGKSYN